ncbi:dihydrofolate reductase family protein [Pontibacter liquoris]|uniref:dihydrofolate reductase family protein n=1 Tax=Pontibacter liquoris TaxID=2905677 RepID=UPI001FA78BED|nr:dihydrofolate reductase family protein [Pontibacter liquoris]
MRRVILYIAASQDGYIARPDGSIDWLEDAAYALEGVDFGYSAFMQSIDTTLMGHTTYKQVLGFDAPFPYSDKTNYVFSRSAHPDTAQAHFVHEDPATFTRQLQQLPGKDIWLIGGSELNTVLLNAGLINEVIITTIPVILGQGIPLFAIGAQETKLHLHHSRSYQNGFVQTRLEVQ